MSRLSFLYSIAELLFSLLKPVTDRLRKFCLYIAPPIAIVVALVQIALNLKLLFGK